MKHQILAVDDEPHMLRLLERIISEKTPHQITTVSNSLEVPQLLSERTFDLIITDLKMPGMDGIDILKHVREHDRPEEVIIMTAFGSLDSAIEALQQGVFDYITKPFKKEQIMFTIDRAIRWQQIRQEAQRLGEVFDAEPYGRAKEAFDKEYLRRLAIRSGGDPGEMARRSGLPDEIITAAMQDK
jgi:DNA-binding NtrC family response regulator